MKVQLHKRHGTFEMPVMTKRKALADVAALYRLIPVGMLRKPPLETCDANLPKFPEIRSYRDYSSASIVAKDRMVADYLKKFPGFTGEDPEKAAIATFETAEVWCKQANKRIRDLRNGARAPYLTTIMSMAQRKIARVLGNFNVSELLDEACWGPGVTSSVKGSFTDAVNKFQGKPEVSPDFAKSAAQLMSCIPSWSALLADVDNGVWVTPVLNVVPGNRVTFVPKTAKTHRSIAVEPHVNSYFQLGLGRMIRKRLLRAASVNLDDQTTNQRLAQLGSVDDSLATIDLTSASDTVPKELVRDLIGEEWFSWLDMTRSKVGLFPDGKFHLYEKFSSMGNGFTFDLESLIFWAVSMSVAETRGYNTFWVNVMGDDIITPSGCYLRTVRVLSLLGFVVNKQKSFSSGPFRESCGKDYWRGFNVRPVYLKSIPYTPLEWLRIANGIRRLASHWLMTFGENHSLKPAYDFAVSRVPSEFRLRIPDGFGDGGLIVNFDEATPPLADHGWEGYKFNHLVPKAIKRKFSSRSLITAGVHRLSQKGNMIPLRDQVSYKKVTSIAASWPLLGGWV